MPSHFQTLSQHGHFFLGYPGLLRLNHGSKQPLVQPAAHVRSQILHLPEAIGFRPPGTRDFRQNCGAPDCPEGCGEERNPLAAAQGLSIVAAAISRA